MIVVRMGHPVLVELLAVKFDDELLVDGQVDILTLRQSDDLAGEVVGSDFTIAEADPMAKVRLFNGPARSRAGRADGLAAVNDHGVADDEGGGV